MEAPECPVCLQNYDGADVIPRVLGCGHTVCEACLSRLPERFPLTVRCPACTRLVKFPPQGPSSLPKNLDLLSLSPSPIPTAAADPRPTDAAHRTSLPRFWSHELYSAWKAWVLPSLAVSPAERGGLRGALVEEGDREVSLVRLFRLPCLSGSGFEFSYIVRVMKCLSEAGERARNELGSILRACSRRPRKMGRVYGLWADSSNDGFLYLVCERMEEIGLGRIGDSRDELWGFFEFIVETIEALIGLHAEGFVAGFVGLSCFGFDEFGHACVDMSEVLATGRKVRTSVAESVSGRDGEFEVAASNLWKDGVFISPEMFHEFLCTVGVGLECDKSKFLIGYRSDTWSLACLLLRLLIGKEFTEEFPKITDRNGSDWSMLYSTWTERVSSLLGSHLGSDFVSMKDMLMKCLTYEPGSRPLLSEVRRLMRELIIKPQFDRASLKDPVDGSSISISCIILGELCKLPEEMPEKNKEDSSKGGECSDRDFDQIKAESVDKNIVDSLSEGMVKFKDLHGHRDCITGITVGGGFIFSSSFDKTIRVWSLQDFTHVHTFEGHEHKVMAIVYVDQEQPLCISGDSGGGVFVWGVSTPFGQEPLKKWYEQKDWRFSGIHALCFSKNGYVYTGSGDKSIKAWTLQGGLLACTMNGHKSVVSTLAICDEVLYSGSWDGTIRLWSLSDHSPLTILGEDTSGPVTSVLSLSVDRNSLIAAYENGIIKVWRNDVFMRSMQLHQGAIFATSMEGEWLFTGGWDKTVNVQELSGDEFHVDPRPIGTVLFDSAVTVLLFWQGKLFVGCADRLVRCIVVT